MNKKLFVLFLLGMFTLGFSADMEAQNYGRKKKKRKRPTTSVDKAFDDKPSFTQRLWYGSGLNLGLQSNYISLFSIGITPMVGYKVNPGSEVEFSLGPRLGYNFTNVKGPTNAGTVQSGNLNEFEYGVFARIKVPFNIFAHFEIGGQSEQNVYVDNFGNLIVQNNELFIDKGSRPSTKIGLGYASGGSQAMGVEISILYDFEVPSTSLESNFIYRFGLNYNF